MAKKNKHSKASQRRKRELRRQARLHREGSTESTEKEENVEHETGEAAEAAWQRSNLLSAIIMFVVLMALQFSLWTAFKTTNVDQQLLQLLT